MNLVGETVEHKHHYTVETLVYDGPLSSLYSGTWQRMNRDIYFGFLHNLEALKLRKAAVERIREHLVASPGLVQHPNLPDIVDFGEGENLPPFYVMRLPPGQLLCQRLSEGPLTPTETFRILTGVTTALRATRDAGIVHRGPTADRVWVTEDGDAILLGLGEVLYRTDSFTMRGARSVELVWHMPPEVNSGRGATDEAGGEPPSYRDQIGSDATRELEETEAAEVFTVGALAFHCLMGHHPFFSRESGTSAGLQALQSNARLPLQNPTLKPIIDIALHPDPEQRYPNAAELVEEFRVALRIPAPLRDTTDHGDPDAPSNTARRRQERADDTLDSGVSSARLTLWRALCAALFIALIAYAWRDMRRPQSVVITSNPSGLELEEVTGHLVESRGRTPIVLRDRRGDSPITIHTVGPGGTTGPDITLDLDQMQDLGRCRLVGLDATFHTDTPASGGPEEAESPAEQPPPDNE